MITAVILLTPYYRLYTEKLYDSYKLLVPIAYFRPNQILPCEYSDPDPEWEAKYKWYDEDPRTVRFYTARTACIWVEE